MSAKTVKNLTPVNWLTVNEACAVVKVSRRTIYLWLSHGRLVTQRTAGGSLRIREDSLWVTGLRKDRD